MGKLVIGGRHVGSTDDKDMILPACFRSACDRRRLGCDAAPAGVIGGPRDVAEASPDDDKLRAMAMKLCLDFGEEHAAAVFDALVEAGKLTRDEADKALSSATNEMAIDSVSALTGHIRLDDTYGVQPSEAPRRTYVDNFTFAADTAHIKVL